MRRPQVTAAVGQLWLYRTRGLQATRLAERLVTGHEGDRRQEQRGLEVVSFGESAVADECAGDAGEGEEVVGFAFVAADRKSVV